MRAWKLIKNMIVGAIEMQFMFGIDGYMILMIFIIATVWLARIILKTCTKRTFKYSNLLSFCIIGLIVDIILRIFNLNFQKNILEVVICLIINIIIFIIFKCKDKILHMIRK